MFARYAPLLHGSDNDGRLYGFTVVRTVVLFVGGSVVLTVVLTVVVGFCVARVSTTTVVPSGGFVMASCNVGVRSLHLADAGQSHKFPLSCQCKPPAQLYSMYWP